MKILPASSKELYQKTACRYCGLGIGKPFLDLGMMPLANSFLKKEEADLPEFACALRLTVCGHCWLVQLTHVVPPEKMFSHYLYVSSTTQTFKDHFSRYAREAKERFQEIGDPTLAVDIGSNDGLLLSCYEKEGLKAVGVEPAQNLAWEANEKGFRTLNLYFDQDAINRILADYGSVDIVSSNNVFAHIDDIQEVCRNAHRLMSPKGIWILEFPYVGKMLEEMLFDMVYHEHLSYIALAPLCALMNRFGFEIFDVKEVASHGGSLRVFIQKKGAGRKTSSQVGSLLQEETRKRFNSIATYEDFAKRVYQVKDKLTEFISGAKSKGKSISGYGAPAKGNTLINFCRFTAREVDYLVDDNPLKQNLLAPGSKIPIVTNARLFESPTDYVVLFAWNFAAEIMKKLASLKTKGVQFVIPLPEPRLVP